MHVPLTVFTVDPGERGAQAGEQHGVATYRRLQPQFGYDDSPLAWSEASDRHIAEAVKTARPFDHCREVLTAAARRADLVVVGASKTEAVRQDLVEHHMADLFAALCAQDFLPKKGILSGLAARYRRVLFFGDTRHDVEAAEAAGVPMYLVRTGDEAACWEAAGPLIDRFLDGETGLSEFLWPLSATDSAD